LKRPTFRLTVANQITLAFWAVYAPALLLITALTSAATERWLIDSKLNELRVEALLIKKYVDSWEQESSSQLRFFKELDRVARLSPVQQNELLKSLISGDKNRSITIANRKGEVLAGSRPDIARRNTPNKVRQRARMIANEFSCLQANTPTQATTPLSCSDTALTLRRKFDTAERLTTAMALGPSGPGAPRESERFIYSSINLDHFFSDSQLATIEYQISLGTVTGQRVLKLPSNQLLPSFVLTKNISTPMLAFNGAGQLLPSNAVTPASPSWRTIQESISSECRSQLSRGVNCQTRVQFHGERYIVNVRSSESGLGVIATLPLRQVSAEAEQSSRKVLLLGLGLMLLGTLVMRRVAQQLSAPIVEASATIKDLSAGNFNIQLQRKPLGELGTLYTNIRITAQRLQQLLLKEQQAAVSLREIETAKAIQNNFLPLSVDVANRADVAALCEPALSVGADWYDVIPVESGTVFVLADVCDKGVGSALFMSVFRSLIRFFVQQVFIDQPVESSGDQERLQQVLSKVNSYMAENHGESSMFATIFLALHRPLKQQLLVVNGGHEATLLVAQGIGPIQELKASGPAVGIFDGARYGSYACDCPPGSWILMYSDGLPDACNHDGERFGHERSERCFLNAIGSDETRGTPTAQGAPTAQSVLQTIRGNVSSFCGDAAAFDDLTMMVVHCQGGALPG